MKYLLGSCVIFLCCLHGGLLAQEELSTDFNSTGSSFNETTTTDPDLDHTYLAYCNSLDNRCPYAKYQFCNLQTLRCECAPGAKYNWTISECQPCYRMDYFTCFECCPWSGYTCNFGKCEAVPEPTWPSYPDPIPPTNPNNSNRLSTPMVVFLAVLATAVIVALTLWRRFCRNLTKASFATRVETNQIPPPYASNFGSNDTTVPSANRAASSGQATVVQQHVPVTPSAPDTVVVFSETTRPAMRMPAELVKRIDPLDDLPPSYMEAIVSQSAKDRTS